MSALEKILHANLESVTIKQSPNEHEWHRRFVLETFIHCVPDSKTYNGFVDSRQVLTYFKDGEEIARFENGVTTYTPKFKELCHELVDKTFATAS